MTIKTVGIIGAGTMGSGIAAHLVNAGLQVILLDIPTPDLTEAEEANAEARNRLVTQLFERMVTGRPVQLGRKALASQITLGNTEDDLGRLAGCDWVIEVIIEKLAPKQALMARLEKICRPDAIISSNTSGIPIHQIAANCSDGFRARFLGTHFFNPPRYLKLLEIIPTADTDPAAVKAISSFGRDTLGKGVVVCKDTPNFIANRFGAVTGAFIAETALAGGYAVADVDMLVGPLIGRPKTGYFRLADLVGLDIRASVLRNLYPAIPHDPYRELLVGETFWPVFDTMMANSWIGNKAGQGFNKKVMVDGQRQFWTLDPSDFEYKPTTLSTYPSVEALNKERSVVKRIKGLLAADDAGANLVKAVVFNTLEYAAYVAPEIAYSLADVDNAVRWGFNHQIGPFELWDGLGVAETAAQMEASGHQVANWVKEMLASGRETFYAAGGVIGFNGQVGSIDTDPQQISISATSQSRLAENESATLHDIGDRLLLFEFHSKANAIDSAIFDLGEQALELLDKRFDALIVANEGRHFCAGARLNTQAEGDQSAIADAWIRRGQRFMMALRHHAKPIVMAVQGKALGGGAELLMQGRQVVAAHEAGIGLVELNVGLMPGWTGNKELLRRLVNPMADSDQLFPVLEAILHQLMGATISSSAWEARSLGYLSATDTIVMNPDHRLFHARQTALRLVAENDPSLPIAPIYAAGVDVREALIAELTAQQANDKLSAFDVELGTLLAGILTGGETQDPDWVDPWVILDAAREASLSIRFRPESVARRAHMLKTGRPLRN
ncbi:MAG: 3-hydroxyacyl-CoA dehydrogenase NAD-binding domain-containing protein [Chloroflexota bacterium]